MRQVIALIHAHTTASDGRADAAHVARQAAKAGVEVLALTDHDVISPGGGWHVFGRRRVLVIAGTELTPRHNHLLAFGLDKPLPKLRGDGHDGDPGRSLEQIARRGGWAALAHPLDPGVPGGKAFVLLDFSRIGSGGVELWNCLSALKQGVGSHWLLLARVLMPRTFLAGPHRTLLALWDSVGRRRRWVGFGGADAHQFGSGPRWLPLKVYSYRRHMGLVCTGLWLEAPLAADSGEASAQVLAALAAGRCFAALGPARGFRCRLVGPDGAAVLPGAELAFGPGWRVEARLPAWGKAVLRHNGRAVAWGLGRRFVWPADAPGVWRVEAMRLRPPLGWRPWIFCNPFYLREPEP